MKRTQWLQETRMIRFEEAYFGWSEHRLTQGEAARLLGVHERTFRRYINRYHEDGLGGLLDKRLAQISFITLLRNSIDIGPFSGYRIALAEITLKKYHRFIPNLTREDDSAFEKFMDREASA